MWLVRRRATSKRIAWCVVVFELGQALVMRRELLLEGVLSALRSPPYFGPD